jgi:hypothetical protein
MLHELAQSTTMSSNFEDFLWNFVPVTNSFFVASPFQGLSNRSLTEPPELFIGFTSDRRYWGGTVCKIKTSYVDVRVLCMSKGTLGKANCGVSSVRRTVIPTENESTSILQSSKLLKSQVESYGDFRNSYNNTLNWFHASFMSYLTNAQEGMKLDTSAPNMIDLYLEDPLKTFIPFESRPEQEPVIRDTDVKLVERRLSLLYNTLWKAGWGFRSLTNGNMTATKVAYLDSLQGQRLAPADINMTDILLDTTSDVTFPLPSVYTIDVPWMVVYFVSVGIMLSASLVALILHARCTAPSMLGYTSSLVRDSVFFDQDNVRGNSTESGTQKAKRLGSLKVVFADVGGDGEVGRMAFAPGERQAKIRKGKWYE